MLNLEEYQGHGATVRQQLKDELAKSRPFSREINSLANAAALADANLRLLLPQLSNTARSAAFEELCWQQRMALSDQHELGLLARSQISDPAGTLGDAQPRIFCTYHLGSYRLLLHAFAQAGKDVCLFANGVTLKRQGESFLTDASLARELGWTGRFETIDANSPQCALQGLRALRRGKSLVLYIDGNSGAGAQDPADLTTVDFFGQRLRARSGIAGIAQLAGVAIVPVVCHREPSMIPRLQFLPGVDAGRRGDKASLQEVTQRLYGILETHTRANPGQWEGWLYVHRWLEPAPVGAEFEGGAEPLPEAPQFDTAAWRVNEARFALLNYPGQSVLLDRHTRRCTPVNASCVAQLERLACGLPPDANALLSSPARPDLPDLARLGVLSPMSPGRSQPLLRGEWPSAG